MRLRRVLACVAVTFGFIGAALGISSLAGAVILPTPTFDYLSVFAEGPSTGTSTFGSPPSVVYELAGSYVSVDAYFNGFPGQGTVTYSVYSDAQCQDSAHAPINVGIFGGPGPMPAPFPPTPAVVLNTPGNYYWQATMVGPADVDYPSGVNVTGPCGLNGGPSEVVVNPTLTALAIGTTATVTWTGIIGGPTELARDGNDSTGAGPWNSGQLTNQPADGSFTFEHLIPGDTYDFSLFTNPAFEFEKPLVVEATIPAAAPPSPPVVTPPPSPTPPAPPVVTSPTTTTGHGYWLVGSDGGIFTFGSAQFYGSTGALRLNRPIVGITPTTDRGGYWLDASDGGIFSFGNAGFFGSIPGLGIAPAGSGLPRSLSAPIVGMVPTADGHGYFMVGADGGVFTFGDAHFEGSCPAIGGCSGGPAVSVIPDSTGNGYWLVTVGGGVTPFGDAPDLGSVAAAPVVSAARSFDGGGYYLLYSNGVVYAFGDAVNYGSASGEVGGSNPAATIFTTADGGGYWIVSSNGSVVTEGDAPYDGGANSLHLNGSIIAGTGW